MASSTEIDWNRDELSSLVSIGDRKLYLHVAGRARTPGQPVVVVEAGMGDDSRTWGAVSALVSKFARIYTYDRAGANNSKPYPGPDPRTTGAMAKDLSDLLAAAKVPGPYLVVSHSYGGLIAREFLALKDKDVIGMVFVDTNTERTQKEIPIPMEALGAVAGELNYYEVTGMNRDVKIDLEVWETVKGDPGASEQERAGEQTSISELAGKKQFERQVLEDRPVVVIQGDIPRDLRKFYDAAVEEGNGTEEDRGKILEMLEALEEKSDGLQREQLKLSSKGWFVRAENSGHNVQLTEPELVAREIEKVLKEIKGKN